MAFSEQPQVTVDKSYFDALLRRADFHTSAQLLRPQDQDQDPDHDPDHDHDHDPDPTSVTISKVEYDSLLQESREFQLLKQSLFQGGLTPDSLSLLIHATAEPKSTQPSINSWADDCNEMPPAYPYGHPSACPAAPRNRASWRSGASVPSFNLAPGSRIFHREARHPAPLDLRVSDSRRRVSCAVHPASVLDNILFDEADSLIDEHDNVEPTTTQNNGTPLRTLYFSGLSARTTYRDLLSVIKGGKLLGVNLRSERSATATFADGAADYLAWVKRNDIYVQGKRVEVKWAEHQYQLNDYINNKLANGATRNILIRSAVEKGLTEAQIREDMEHIHNLVIIDVTFRHGHAYVSTNSVHNALFARTCMMSRTAYRGCKIEFYLDECNVPLPVRAPALKSVPQDPAGKKIPTNRFDMLDIDGGASGSDEENRVPHDSAQSDEENDSTVSFRAPHDISLRFLDDDSTT